MNKVLEQIESGDGKLTLNGTRYLLIRPETLIAMQKRAYANEAIIGGGYEGGKLTSAGLAQEMKGREVLEAMARMGAEIGWGLFRVARYDEHGFEVTVENSPFAEAYGRSEAPVCCFIAGVLGGVGTTLFRIAECEEIECVACGAPRCRFVCHA